MEAHEYIEATVASAKLSALLDIDKGSPILKATRYGYNQNDEIVEFSSLITGQTSIDIGLF